MSRQTAIKEKPILFSAPMVRAILDGRKTVTRRIVKLNRWGTVSIRQDGITYGCYLDEKLGLAWRPFGGSGLVAYPQDKIESGCPFGAPGDRLWVREKWQSAYARGCWGTLFAADESFVQGKRQHTNGPHLNAEDRSPAYPPKWKPSIHLPRWASRLMLEVVSVRVERLQEITEEDARDEGVGQFVTGAREGNPDQYRATFRDLWDSLHVKRERGRKTHNKAHAELAKDFSWDANPWVWRIEFRRAE